MTLRHGDLSVKSRRRVQHEVEVDGDFEIEHGSRRGGFEAHAIRNEECLVDDEEDANHDPLHQPFVVRVNQWGTAAAVPWEEEHPPALTWAISNNNNIWSE